MGCCASKKDAKKDKKMDASKSGEGDSTPRNQKEFVRLVKSAMDEINDFCTMCDIESYISTHHRTTVDAFTRRKIICKVITDEFFVGNIAVRTKKQECI